MINWANQLREDEKAGTRFAEDASQALVALVGRPGKRVRHGRRSACRLAEVRRGDKCLGEMDFSEKYGHV